MRMRAQSLRRSLWFADIVLGAGVVGLAAWWFLGVKPAAVDTALLEAPYAAQEVERHEACPRAGVAPDIEVIDRPDYRPLNYWIFSGPLPPPPAVPAPDAPEVDLPTGLETLGRVTYVIFLEGSEGQEVSSDSRVIFEFNDKKRGGFKPGMFIHQPGQPERFKLIDVRPSVTGAPLYEIVYDVHDDPAAPPVRRAQLTYGARPPGMEVPPRPRDQVEVEFDQATYDALRGTSVESLAETVKTQPAVDRKTGQVRGLRITGFLRDSPVDKFNVKPGDILVSVNGTPVGDRANLVALIQRMDPDISRVTAVIDRGGRKLTYHIDPRDPKTRRSARYLENAK